MVLPSFMFSSEETGVISSCGSFSAVSSASGMSGVMSFSSVVVFSGIISLSEVLLSEAGVSEDVSLSPLLSGTVVLFVAVPLSDGEVF